MLLQLVQPAYACISSINQVCSSTSHPVRSAEVVGGHFPTTACVHDSIYRSIKIKCTSSESSGTANLLTAHPADRCSSSSGGSGSSCSSSAYSGPDKSNGIDGYEPGFSEAVLVLQADLPLLFQRDMRYHIYRDDITFRTPSMHCLTGVWKYQVLHRGARWLGWLLLRDAQLQLVRLWQPEASRRTLKVHWHVSGQPRLPLLVGGGAQSIEGFSTYSFDSGGRIYEHQVDQFIPPESPLVKLLEWMIGRLQSGAALPTPQLPVAGMDRG